MPHAQFHTGAILRGAPPVLGDLASYSLGKLPTPPGSLEVPGTNGNPLETYGHYPILGNATYGDCVIAGAAHIGEAWNLITGEHNYEPNEQEADDRYFVLTGGEDTGLVIANFLHVWHTQGNFKTKLAGYTRVNPQNLLQMHQSIYVFGGVYLGILCPESAQRQASEQEQTGQLVPWTYEGGNIAGGHCIVGLGWLPNGNLLCASWGMLVEVTAGFVAHYFQEAYALIGEQYVEKGGNARGVDLAALKADLDLI